MYKIILRMAIALGLITTLGTGTVINDAWLASLYRVEWQRASYEESAKQLGNPDCGWYEIYGYELSDGRSISGTLRDHIKGADANTQLVLLEFNLRQFASADISDAGISQINEALDAWSQTGRHFIVRFLYDWDGHGMENEPDHIEQIQSHMRQVAVPINAHKNQVLMVQGILVGNCGEMNASKFLDPESMTTLMKTWAEVLDPQIYLSARTPEHVRIIRRCAGATEGLNPFDGSLAARLGLFNDGMLGSDTDLGTYGDSTFSQATDYSGKGTRAEELEFQDQLCLYVPNGGEVVLDNAFNDCPEAYETLAKMHVSYLNRMHMAEVLNKWKGTSYQGAEQAFVGGSAYDYIGAHLGYRYVMRESAIDRMNYLTHEMRLTMTVENIGFAPAYRSYDCNLAIYNAEGTLLSMEPLACDNRSWQPGEAAELECTLSTVDMEPGTYHVYLVMQDASTGSMISFAHNAELPERGVDVGTFTLEQIYGE